MCPLAEGVGRDAGLLPGAGGFWDEVGTANYAVRVCLARESGVFGMLHMGAVHVESSALGPLLSVEHHSWRHLQNG